MKPASTGPSQTRVENKIVKVGDWVGFKSDIEQGGQITLMRNTPWGVEFVLENENGFSGEYIGGDTRTTVMADDCWVD